MSTEIQRCDCGECVAEAEAIVKETVTNDQLIHAIEVMAHALSVVSDSKLGPVKMQLQDSIVVLSQALQMRI